MKRSHRDWAKIRAHYESSGESLRQVAALFGIPERTVFRWSAREGWRQTGNKAAGDSSAEERLIERFGAPFFTRIERSTGAAVAVAVAVDFNYLHWAAKFAGEKPLIYRAATASFHAPAGEGDSEGCILSEPELWLELASFLLRHSRRLGQPVLETHRPLRRLRAMAQVLKALSLQPEEQPADPHLHRIPGGDPVFEFYRSCRSYLTTARHFGLSVSAVKSRAKRKLWAELADRLDADQNASTKEERRAAQ
jgi:hypothetical protein